MQTECKCGNLYFAEYEGVNPFPDRCTACQSKENALQIAIDELADVQFCDNTWQEAIEAKLAVENILRKLAENLSIKGETQ